MIARRLCPVNQRALAPRVPVDDGTAPEEGDDGSQGDEGAIGDVLAPPHDPREQQERGYQAGADGREEEADLTAKPSSLEPPRDLSGNICARNGPSSYYCGHQDNRGQWQTCCGEQPENSTDHD